jgi:Domain of unknown function (DUF4436)
MRLVHRLARQVLPFVVLAALVASGLLLYSGERDGQQQGYILGDDDSASRLDITITILKLDPAAQQLTVEMLPDPKGDLTTAPGSLVPARSFTVETSSLVKSVIQYPADQRVTATDLTVNAQGITSDYPFDRYSAQIGLSAHAGGATLPVSLTLDDADPSFRLAITRSTSDTGYATFDVSMKRSRSTLIFVCLMAAVMWALALAVAAAARVQVRRRRGLTWPALGWMAATLFALTAFRNAAPGSPPIGSILDYAAYLWAELIVAVSLVVTVIAGIRAENVEAEAEARRA